MIHKVRFVLAVPDLKRSADFYRDVLGFEVKNIEDDGWRFFEKDNCYIMAGECPDAIPPKELGDHSWFAYLYEEDVDAYHDAVVARGAEITKKLKSEPWGMREFGVRTVDGHRIMFGQILE